MPLYAPAGYQSATSTAYTPAASSSSTYYSLTGNSVTLSAGSWQLDGQCLFSNGGTSPGYSSVLLAWSTANGAATSPTLQAGNQYTQFTCPSSAQLITPAATIRITVTSNTTIYLVPNIVATTTQNASITTYIYAQNLPSFP